MFTMGGDINTTEETQTEMVLAHEMTGHSANVRAGGGRGGGGGQGGRRHT